jgi:thiamine biosynthesis lipoprotein
MTLVLPRLHRHEAVMGTHAQVALFDPVPDENLLEETFSWLHAVDERFSTYKDTSEINRLDRGEVEFADCSTDMREVLDACGDLWWQTEGFFDLYATGRLDPSGYVKGWAVQVASQRLTAAGAVNHLIEAGGDVQTRGEPSPGQPWHVRIRHPWERDKVCFVIAGTDLAVATSGLYERGLHVINPRTGQPADLLSSVTVVGRDLGPADAYATAAVAMGEAALGWLARLKGYESAVIKVDGTSYTSAGLPLVAA